MKFLRKIEMFLYNCVIWGSPDQDRRKMKNAEWNNWSTKNIPEERGCEQPQV